MQWPIDFNEEEKETARQFVKKHLNFHPQDAGALEPDEEEKVIKNLIDEAPIEAIQTGKIMGVLCREGCREFNKIKDKSPDRKAGRHRSLVKERATNNPESEYEAAEAKMSLARQTRDKRKRFVVEEDDDDVVDSGLEEQLHEGH
ncbi:hypothetical protein OPT61_g7829 [Boeremia exigua]|uniref:Uncharacterized protein n=1 Tax=Boeremia exigua TaxID=749465 RepID=A0ACC2I1U1_9PLEO|nr:hypothetical protein OPT61_g7829 [Boeremia exigua]